MKPDVAGALVRPEELEKFLVENGMPKPGAAIGVLTVFIFLRDKRKPGDGGVPMDDLVEEFLVSFSGFYTTQDGQPLKGKRAEEKVRREIVMLFTGHRALENYGGRLFASAALLRRFPQLEGKNKTLPAPVRFQR